MITLIFFLDLQHTMVAGLLIYTTFKSWWSNFKDVRFDIYAVGLLDLK